jgi:hypothetical protein
MTYKLFFLALLLFLVSCTSQQRTSENAAPKPTTTPQANVLDLDKIQKMVADPEASQRAAAADRGTFAWQLFVNLNSPLTGRDAKNWETNYRDTNMVFLKNGCPPPPWGPTQTPAAALEQAKSLPNWGPNSQTLHTLDMINKFQVSGLVLKDKWNQAVLYQILMNQPAFEYIVQRGFYNVEGQEQAAKDNKPADFPTRAFELKTSWIWIGADFDKFQSLNGKYYIVPAYYENIVNGQSKGFVVGYAALSGMHIINKGQPKWIWITFENVNNPEFTQVKLELPVPEYARQANQIFQQQLQALGSVFANYQLDGVQMDFNDPTLLANSNIESAFQSQSSCMTCHALATIKPNGARFNLVNNQGGNVGYYTGNPPDLSGYTSLDFVWSMKRASRKNANVCKEN